MLVSKRVVTLCLSAIFALFDSSGVLSAPDVLQAQLSSSSRPGGEKPALEPASVAALERMGDYLVKLSAFEITAAISFEYVFDNDQKILIGGTVRHRVRRPDRVRIDLTTDVLDRIYQYDGRSLIGYGAAGGLLRAP